MRAIIQSCLIGAAVGSGAPRYWPHFTGEREVTTLDGIWSYGLLASPGYPSEGAEQLPADFDSMDPNFNPTSAMAATPNQTKVPSCMDTADPGYLGTRGVAMYRTTFDHSGPARLQFQACSFYCRIWVDGVEIGSHLAGGYVAFTVDMPAGGDSPRELFVLADNRFNETTAPMHTGGDFWHYGGIMRSVELHTLPVDDTVPWPWRAYVLPTTGAAHESVDITVVLTDKSYSGPVEVSLAFDDSSPVKYEVQATDGSARLDAISVPNPKIWSTHDPQLHSLAVTVNAATVVERFGLREFGVEASSARLTVNGEVLKLVGWNHHTQWPETAASPSDEQMDADIALLKQGGTNYVRGAHYPQDPRWLDRLDEAGIVMWCETLGPGVSVKNTQDPAWMSVQLTQLNEMLDNAMNHAAVMAWGWFNEGPSNKAEACPGYAACTNLTRSRDPTRFTTWASDKDLGDKCLEHASLISFNNYPKWYNNQDPTDQWNRFANGVRAGTSQSGEHTLGKPFVISETGAGGIYEWDKNDTDAKWTLNLQNEIIAQDVDVAIGNDNISGITLWHFFDFKVNDAQENNTHCEYIPDMYPPNCSYIEINGRPGGINHKGVIDFWRRPKPAFQMVAAKYNATKQASLVI